MEIGGVDWALNSWIGGADTGYRERYIYKNEEGKSWCYSVS